MTWRRLAVGLGAFALISALTLGAKDFLAKDFHEWSRAEVVKLFNDSPWALKQTTSSESISGRLGGKELQYAFTARLLSARPMREAYYRMLQLMNNYDTLAPDRRQELDSRINWLLNDEVVKDEVVVAVSYVSNDQEGKMNIKRFLDTATMATLNQSAYLFCGRGRVDLIKYIPPGQESVGARFIFPRVYQGEPVVKPGDKELRFQVYVAPIAQTLLVGFKPAKLVYKGGLAY